MLGHVSWKRRLLMVGLSFVLALFAGLLVWLSVQHRDGGQTSQAGPAIAAVTAATRVFTHASPLHM